MTHAHICVWIDHREAKIFGIGLNAADEIEVKEKGPHHHLHRKADHVGQGKELPDREFLKSVADVLNNARGILITGPGTAKSELADYLRRHAPATAGHVWGVEPLDHPTDAELVAWAGRRFRAADHMRA
jgi:stalled ribosome rescue protein Dom34